MEMSEFYGIADESEAIATIQKHQLSGLRICKAIANAAKSKHIHHESAKSELTTHDCMGQAIPRFDIKPFESENLGPIYLSRYSRFQPKIDGNSSPLWNHQLRNKLFQIFTSHVWFVDNK